MDIDIPLPGEDVPLCDIEPPDIPMPDDPIELASRVLPEPASESVVDSTVQEIDAKPPPLPAESSSTVMENEEDEDIDDSNR